jgi:hypothetical protein
LSCLTPDSPLFFTMVHKLLNHGRRKAGAQSRKRPRGGAGSPRHDSRTTFRLSRGVDQAPLFIMNHTNVVHRDHALHPRTVGKRDAVRLRSTSRFGCFWWYRRYDDSIHRPDWAERVKTRSSREPPTDVAKPHRNIGPLGRRGPSPTWATPSRRSVTPLRSR